MVTFDVELEGPIDLPATLEWFGQWGDDLLARWDGRVLTQTVRYNGRSVPVSCLVSGTRERPALRVIVRHERHIETAQSAVSRMIVSGTRSLSRLVEIDPIIARLNGLFPGTRPVLQLDPFTALIRSISAQQVNLKWALTTRNRLARAFGIKHRLGDTFVYSLDPRRLAMIDCGAIRALQFTTSKSRSILAVAHAIVNEDFRLENLHGSTDASVVEMLTSLPGIGVWTAQWYLARTLGRPCVVAGDLGLRKAVGRAYCNGRLPTEREVRAITDHWGAAATLAQHLLLYALRRNAL